MQHRLKVRLFDAVERSGRRFRDDAQGRNVGQTTRPALLPGYVVCRYGAVISCPQAGFQLVDLRWG